MLKTTALASRLQGELQSSCHSPPGHITARIGALNRRELLEGHSLWPAGRADALL
ncbi:hypothetical protein [Acidovorax sp.]|uniref:hypothetical protein n=1 Tax=Acidovorax sp. TaxID=1872122 RepID=UPI002ACDFB06|nr:hypothetical protein [Acidovorax sp.]MDZ7862105.1 hypothetical protein [Acidovorax sp.]